MSGTSLDGVDAVLADFSTPRPTVMGHTSAPLAPALKSELLALNAPGEQELHRAALAANALVRLYAQQVQALLKKAHVSPMQVRAIGAHGQTVRHRPSEFDGTGYTLQLNQPALLAELCGIDVVADFRSRDVAAGGQGAPLVPPFHQAFFGDANQPMAVLNIGGISNLTLINPHGHPRLIGFDCGPGNALMDAWCHAHTGAAFDDEGAWAAQGVVQPDLLSRMKAEPFFSKPAPKSTGRDLFNSAWLSAQLRDCGNLAAQDVQATLTELTAQTCAESLLAQPAVFDDLVVCGGGAFNRQLMRRLQACLPACHVRSSEAAGLPPLQVEATAFAWLARQAVLRNTSSVASVTGACGDRILGAIYPA